MTNKPPAHPGYYWYYDGRGSPLILYVERDYPGRGRGLYASNESVLIRIEKDPKSFWSARIPNPQITARIKKAVRIEHD